MRVTIEKGDKPELVAMFYSMQQCLRDIVIEDKRMEQTQRLLSDTVVRDAIISVMPYFSVRSQWVAIYRILVDYLDYPSEIAAFFKRINHLMRGTHTTFAPDYQSIQKPLAASGILQKPYHHVRTLEGRQDI